MAFVQSATPHWVYGAVDAGAESATPAIDSAFVVGVSGDAFLVQFTSPVSQSAATITVYVYIGSSITGSPTYQLNIYDAPTSGDPDRIPAAASNLASSPSTLSPAGTSQWQSLTATVSLTAGNTYFVCVVNTAAVPASNHTTFVYRGALDQFLTASNTTFWFTAGYTLDGFVTDPVTTALNGTGRGTAVIKFGDGSILGFPYVSTTAHASNANDRGIRVKFSEDFVVSGIFSLNWTSSISNVRIYKSDGTSIVNVVPTFYDSNRGQAVRFSPVTLEGGVSYDVVLDMDASTTAIPKYTMGSGTIPADVEACRPLAHAYVDGTTPGSYTIDNNATTLLLLLLDDNPAIAGGSISVAVSNVAIFQPRQSVGY